jgi:hypothetical protein
MNRAYISQLSLKIMLQTRITIQGINFESCPARDFGVKAMEHLRKKGEGCRRGTASWRGGGKGS